MKITVIGAGLVGLATALELKRLNPEVDLEVLEKERQAGAHQSTHNSGVLHAGLYYRPGTLKAKLAVRGIRRMVAFCQEHEVPHEICGKVVVATTNGEVSSLQALVQRGRENGLRGLRWLRAEELREIEPHASGVAAVFVPEEGIVDYARVVSSMHRKLERSGVQVRVLTGAKAIHCDGSGWRIDTKQGEVGCDFLINCAGLYSDQVAQMAGEALDVQIVPFRGEYYALKPAARHLVRNLIYPTPDPKFPFLGVHFTRQINGGVEAGPNAVLAFAREGYNKWTVRPRELLHSIAFKGLWRFLRRHQAMVQEEVRRSFSAKLFCASLQRLVPEIRLEDLAPGGAGVRAQAMNSDGTLIQDFHFLERRNALHVLNAPSPAATASLAIGEYIAQKVLRLVAG